MGLQRSFVKITRPPTKPPEITPSMPIGVQIKTATHETPSNKQTTRDGNGERQRRCGMCCCWNDNAQTKIETNAIWRNRCNITKRKSWLRVMSRPPSQFTADGATNVLDVECKRKWKQCEKIIIKMSCKQCTDPNKRKRNEKENPTN